MTPTGGVRGPLKTNAAFERALKGQCFCPRKGHNPNCKAVGFPCCGVAPLD